MKKVWTILPIVAAFAAAPAFAQDSGFTARAELRAGYDELRAELEIQDSARTGDANESAIGYGAEVGVDFRLTSTILVGAYVGLDLSNIDQCSEVFPSVFAGDEACIDAGRNFTAGLRAGLPLGDGNLIYVKAGYSNAKIKGSFATNGQDLNTQLFSASDTVGGYHLGAGFELGLNQLGLGDGFYVKAEYVHTRYSDAFKSDLGQGESFNSTRHQVLGGVGIRFGAAR